MSTSPLFDFNQTPKCTPAPPLNSATNTTKIIYVPVDVCEKLPDDPTLRFAESVSAVALFIFASYVNSQLTLSFFIIGVSASVYNRVNSLKDYTFTPSLGACAQSTIDRIMRVKLPPRLAFVAEIGLVVRHLEELSTVLCPYIGFDAGINAVRLAVKIRDYAQPHFEATVKSMRTGYTEWTRPSVSSTTK